jgi:hypothetical protein
MIYIPSPEQATFAEFSLINAVLPVGADHNRAGAGFTDAFTGADGTGIMKVSRIMPIRNGNMFRKFFITVSFVRCTPGNKFINLAETFDPAV